MIIAAGYSATKHAVSGIFHSLYMELREFGINVTRIVNIDDSKCQL